MSPGAQDRAARAAVLFALVACVACARKGDEDAAPSSQARAFTPPVAPLGLLRAHAAATTTPRTEAADVALELALVGHRKAAYQAVRAALSPAAQSKKSPASRWLAVTESDVTRATLMVEKGRLFEARKLLAATYARKTPEAVPAAANQWIRQDILAVMAAIENRAGFGEAGFRGAEKGLSLGGGSTVPRLMLLTEQARALARLGRHEQAGEVLAAAAGMRAELEAAAPHRAAPQKR